MSNNYALSAAKREQAGKGVARSLRRESRVPGVIYGDAKPPVKISLPDKEINLEYRKGHMFTSLCDLDVAGEKHLALARDVQLNPVTDRVEHVDFMRVTPKTTIRAHVPVHFINHSESPGLKEKAVLNVVMHEIDLICLATAIPDHINVDLTGKKIGEAVRLSDAKLPDGAKLPKNVRETLALATLQAPRAYVEQEITAPTPDAAAGAAAPAAAGAAATPAAGAKPDAKAAPAAGAKAPAAPAKK